MELKINSKETSSQFDEVVGFAKELFTKKTKDYGTAWRILRLTSITDQIFIKAERIKTLEETGKNKVGDSIEGEYIGILNYSVIALIQIEIPENSPVEMKLEETISLYEKEIKKTKDLLFAKNHDYGEAWRKMRITSITDLILQKIHRVKSIEDQKGQTIASEGVDANYRDMINYAIFALIRLKTDRTN